ncbi:MAG TPA: hypothetical protein VM686_20340, partial [Polyangiaceae bacterium]|nr:hypothetical protein [Polyangiaceae bacterium]
PIDCPPEHRDAAKPDRVDDERPAGKEKWLRVLPALYVAEREGTFQLDRFCPSPGSEGACDQYRDVKVPCQPPAGRERFVQVPAFEVPRAAGRCWSYPTLRCEPQRSCELPAARVVACKTELAQ